MGFSLALSPADSNEIALSVEESKCGCVRWSFCAPVVLANISVVRSALRAKLGLKPLNLGADAATATPGNSSMLNDVLVAPVVPFEAERTGEVRAGCCFLFFLYFCFF